MGYCHRVSPLARKYCRLSCGLCTVGVAQTPSDDLQEGRASVQVGSGMSVSGARRGAPRRTPTPTAPEVVKVRALRPE